MASNTVLNSGTGGDVIATKERTHDGDATKVQVVTVAGVTGTEGSYTFTDVAAGGGIEAAALRVTIASDSTGVLSVDDNGGTLTVDGTVTANLAAGTNNIGDVDVLSIVPGTGATNLGKAEDSAHTSGDVGVMMLAVRQDSHSDLGADGDYIPPTIDADGGLRVSLVSGGVDGVVDDAAFTPGTTETVAVGFFADETSTDSVDEGDLGAARMSLDRKQYVIAHHETSTIYQNGTARTPVFAAIDAATSGDNTLVAAAGAGNKIRVHQLFLVSAGTVNVRFESGAAGAALTGQMNLVANTGFVLPYSPIGWFETAANTLLNLELSAAVSVDGNLAYTVVT